MMGLVNTGERILLEKETALMIARHLSAYRFAGDYASNQTVLDIGCGEGYGSYFLAGMAKEVTAIDYDKAVIDYAKNKYIKENLHFFVIDVKHLNTVNNKFDLIYAFQLIEHIEQVKRFLIDVKSLLKNDGMFICSTPNKKDASPQSAAPLNKFHIKEYLLEEFKELLGADFKKVEVFGLKRGRQLNFYRRLKKVGLFNFLPANLNPVKKFYGKINCNNFIIADNNISTALDFIAVCKK